MAAPVEPLPSSGPLEEGLPPGEPRLSCWLLQKTSPVQEPRRLRAAGSSTGLTFRSLDLDAAFPEFGATTKLPEAPFPFTCRRKGGVASGRGQNLPQLQRGSKIPPPRAGGAKGGKCGTSRRLLSSRAGSALVVAQSRKHQGRSCSSGLQEQADLRLQGGPGAWQAARGLPAV